ncbi:MAG: hypothetical protein ACM3NQ_14065 [Bacteroidales bacterium]
MRHRTLAMAAGIALWAAPLFAQGTVTAQGNVTVQHEKQVIADKIQVELAQQMKMSVMGHVTTGAPYSAETINEFVQLLPDGNRISRRTVSRVYRDSQGRTRTEQLETNGPLLGSNVTQVITITDPVAGTTYMLYPDTHTAVQNDAVIVRAFKTIGDANLTTSGANVVVGKKLEAEKKAAEVEHLTFNYSTAPGAAANFYYYSPESGKNATREDLGEQTIEGVLATGTRTTTVIPAGTIGNDQPIRVVSEEWISKDLGILVLTRHSDPRTGETTYRVTNVNRAEPDPTLFQVPADYKMQLSVIKRDRQ